jgi:hypothetical protein
MNSRIGSRALASAMLLIGVAAAAVPAGAEGTANIQRSDGSVRTFPNVHVVIQDDNLWLTSADRAGTLIIGKSACTKIGEMVRCLPYDAMLVQDGKTRHIPLQNGTVWFNPAATAQPLTHSSTEVPPHGVLMTAETTNGFYVSLTGVVDEVKK